MAFSKEDLKSIDITFSEQYANLLKTVTNVTKANCTILQHVDEKYRISIPNQALLTHIAAGEKDISFDADRINLFSLTEFMKYADAINYPKRGSVSLAQEISVTGKRYEYVKFASPGLTCRTPTADPSCFQKTDAKIPQPRGQKKMVRLVEICLTADTLKDFEKKLKLVPTCKFITLFIDGGGVKLVAGDKVAVAAVLMYCFPQQVGYVVRAALGVDGEGFGLHTVLRPKAVGGEQDGDVGLHLGILEYDTYAAAVFVEEVEVGPPGVLLVEEAAVLHPSWEASLRRRVVEPMPHGVGDAAEGTHVAAQLE